MSEGSSDKPGPRKLAGTIRTVGSAGSGIRLGKTVGFSVFLLFIVLVIFFVGLPWYISAAIVLVAVIAIAVQTVSYKRVPLSCVAKTDEPIPDSVPLIKDEALIEIIPDVTEYGNSPGVGLFGAETRTRPENALLFTDKSVWALTVPLSDIEDAGLSCDEKQTTRYEDIVASLMEMQTTLSLEEMLRQCRAKKLMSLEEISDVRTPSVTYAISFADRTGRRYGYLIQRKEDYERAKEVLHQP